MICGSVILLMLSLHSIDAYRFLVHSPIFGYSHTNFMGVIADTLTEAGHDVTVLMPVMDGKQENMTGVKLTKKIIKIPPDPRVQEWMKYESVMLSEVWTMQASVFKLMKVMQNMTASFVAQCEAVINDDGLMKQLAEESFDVGISETFDMCGLGIFEALKIPSSIATFSGVHMDVVSKSIGEPIIPSYVPGTVVTTGDRMNFIERLTNAAHAVIGQFFFGSTFTKEVQSFRSEFGPHFKDYEIWDNILNERNTTVFVSFGSVAKSIYMPDEYKKNLLEVFESMPETTFIWKYEEEGSKLAAHLKNVHLTTWAPQNALLADPRLTAFITHGGMGSITELAHFGKPAIIMPIFADQTRNANMLAKHGTGIVLTKFALEHPQILRDSLRRIFTDISFSRNAKRLSEMLLNQPISAEQLLIRHSEFAAEFGRLPNLDPYGRHLSFVEYFLIDIFLVVTSVVIFVAFIVYTIVRRCCCGKTKSKKD
ncbi:hypothetical protein V3C99_007216 [Haemonchus contortus]